TRPSPSGTPNPNPPAPAGGEGAGCSALAVLRSAAGLAAADLLALDLARVAGHEAGLAQRLAQGFIVLHQGAGQTQADGAGLAGDAPTPYVRDHVEAVVELGHYHGMADDQDAGLAHAE